MNNAYTSNWKKWIWYYIAAAVIIYGGIYFYYQNKNSSSGGGLYATTTATPTATGTATPAPLSATLITTQTNATIGSYLSDDSDNTLYTYSGDNDGVSNCTGSCLIDWPIYPVTDSVALPANMTVISRTDGTKQYAYKGMPLYYFTGDSREGQINGNGVGGFAVATP